MDFISNSAAQREEMLKAIGAASIEELFAAIPSKLLSQTPIYDDGLSEFEGMRLMEEISERNTYPEYVSYLGAGAYEHHIPAIVGAICSKSEFLTAYTPYQPEVSQGMLQAIFEFQSSICALTGMDVSNASLYDGASACAEAVLMALRVNKEKSKVLMACSLHPSYQAVVRQYAGVHCELIEVPYKEDFSLDIDEVTPLIDESAAVIFQSPNVFGRMEDAKNIARLAHAGGALAIQCANPLSYGIFYPPSEANIDIAVGDCQPFGLPLNYGGPYAGYIACKNEFLRQLPGRIVGETVDSSGKRGFVLTLQAREQHIRREKATSNVCTNQALAALACLTAIMWYGKRGVPLLAQTNYQRAAYLRHRLQAAPNIAVRGSDASFNEFVLTFPGKNANDAVEYFRREKIIPGHPLAGWYKGFDDSLLVCVTEVKTKRQLDHYVEVAARYANTI